MNLTHRLFQGPLASVCIALLFSATGELSAQSEFVAYSFPGVEQSQLSNCGPQGNLVSDSDGNFYGTTSICLAQDSAQADAVYKLSRPVPPSKAWTRTLLYKFRGGDDGAQPIAGVIFDKAGSLYGTTNAGGTFGFGTVFQLSPPTIDGEPWVETVLYSFKGAPDGESPQHIGVVVDSAGNVYGATFHGGFGTGCGPYNAGSCGVVYRLTPPAVPGGEWTETVIHRFGLSLRGNPASAPILDAKGNLYGSYGGHENFVYKLSPPASPSGAWGFRMLYSFGSSEGVSQGSLTFHGPGFLYLMAAGGVVELVPPASAGGAWTQNILHVFASGGGNNQDDGYDPAWGVTFDNAGNLYGVNQDGGYKGQFGTPCDPAYCGSVFELSPPASGTGAWTETTLHLFGGPDGNHPTSAPFFYSNGVLYGVTQTGGKGGSGVLYGIVK
jgi:uncharacterized repeat protein (TIGR03803 family)